MFTYILCTTTASFELQGEIISVIVGPPKKIGNHEAFDCVVVYKRFQIGDQQDFAAIGTSCNAPPFLEYNNKSLGKNCWVARDGNFRPQM